MKKELSQNKELDVFGFEEIKKKEMNNIFGGAEVIVEIDPETGKVYVILKPKRPS